MSDKKKEFALVVNRRELAVILAALRFYQNQNLQNGSDFFDEAIKDIVSDGGSLTPLDFAGVDRLCERINTCYEKSATRSKKRWAIIVTDGGTVVYVRAYETKTAAKKGLFKYLKEEHGYEGRKSIRAVSEWITEDAEHLNVDIVRQNILDTDD